MSTDEPILTRRTDNAHFRIVAQARSPTGTVQLRGIMPPHETVHTTNDRLAITFSDSREQAVAHKSSVPNTPIERLAAGLAILAENDPHATPWSGADFIGVHVGKPGDKDAVAGLAALGWRYDDGAWEFQT